jgi:hypothetical protein
MTTNKIYIRFQSEQKFEEFKFSGENISCKEVLKDFLAKRKKLMIPTERERMIHPEKTDKIQLINLDKGGEEITDEVDGGMIEANTNILVKRVPFKDYKSIDVQYNKADNFLTKIKNSRRLGLCQPGQSIETFVDDDEDDTQMKQEE